MQITLAFQQMTKKNKKPRKADCSRVKTRSAFEDVTSERCVGCRAEDVGVHFAARQLQKKTGAPVINKPTLGKFYFGLEEKVI